MPINLFNFSKTGKYFPRLSELHKMKRTKQKGQAMNEAQRQTTEKVHKVKIADVWSDYTTTCDKCGNTVEGEESLSGKFFEECLHCGDLKTNIK